MFHHWSASKISPRNVSVSGCGNFSKADEDLNTLVSLAAVYLPRSKDRIQSLLCNYAFTNCSNKSLNDKNICLEFSKFHNKIRRLIPLLENAISCLTIPRCADNSIRPNDSSISNKTTCQRPLIPTKSKYARERGLYCSPLCDQENQQGVKSYYIAMYISVPIHVICLAILFITWARAKGLYVITAAYYLIANSLSTTF